MVALCAWILDVRTADSQHLLQQATIADRLGAQLPPIAQLTAPDDIIDGGQGKSLVVQVPVHMADTAP
jgi:hypothetical protein